jgi:hypothetical protein
MASSLFALLAIFVAGYAGASIWSGGNSRLWSFIFVVCSSAFVLLCWLLGILFNIYPAKLMTICGLGIAALLALALALLSGSKRKQP